MDKKLILTLAAVIAAILLLVLVSHFTSQPTRAPLAGPPQALQHLLLPEPRPLKPFTLTDHNGQALGLEQLTGHWTFIFFGYTHCPDICPTTLGMLKGVAGKLAQQPDFSKETRFLFVSVDPQRDTLPHLKNYITYFHPEFVSATGEQQNIDRLARQLGAVYMFEGDTTRDDYIVNHSASVALINPQGQWVARFNPPHTVRQFHDGYLQLRDYLTTTTSQD